MMPSTRCGALIQQDTNLGVIAIIAKHSRAGQGLEKCSWLRPVGGHEVSWLATPWVVGLSSFDPDR